MKHYRDYISLKLINALSEFVLILIAYFASAGARYYLGQDMIQLFDMHDAVVFLPAALGCGLFSIIFYAVFGDYSTVRVKSIFRELVRIIFVQILSGVTITALLYLIQGNQFSRVWLVMFVAASIVLILVKRVAFSMFSLYWCRIHQGLSNIIIIGTGNNAYRYYRGLEKVLHRECEYAGHLAPEADPHIPGYLGTYDMIDEVIDRTGADEAVICSEIEEKELNKLLIACAIKSVMVYIVPSYNDYLSGGRILST